MWGKSFRSLIAFAVTCGLAFAGVPRAEAHDGGGVGLGIAAGIIGLGVLGAAAAPYPYYGPRYYSRYDDRCYYGSRECHVTERHCFENDYGDTVCRGGHEVCDRPVICP